MHRDPLPDNVNEVGKPDPLRDKVNEVREQIASLQQRADELRKDLDWYSSVNRSAREQELAGCDDRIQQITAQLQSLDAKIASLQDWLRGINTFLPAQLQTLQRIPQGVPEELASSLTEAEQGWWQEIAAGQQSRKRVREDLSRVEEELAKLRQALSQSQTCRAELQKQLDKLQTRQTSLTEEIAWYDSIREPDLSRELTDTRSQIDRRSAECAALQAEITQLRQELTELEKQVGSLWNPLNRFSSEQSNLRLRRRKLQKQLDRLESAEEARRRQLELLRRRQADLEQTLQRYRAFDRAASEAEFSRIQQEVARLTAEAEEAEKRCRTLEGLLRNQSAQRDSLMREQEAIESRIGALYQEILRHRQTKIKEALTGLRDRRTKLAEELEQEKSRSQKIRDMLERYYAFDPDACGNKLEQMGQQIAALNQRLERLEGLIRRRDEELAPLQEKENELERGNIIRDRERKISQINKQLEKLRERIQRIEELYLRMAEMEYIVIDGNNCCYEGDDFIGLAALRVLVPELLRQGFRVAVIFDGSICPMLKRKPAEVKEDMLKQIPAEVQKELGDGAIIFHIALKRQQADGTILALAKDDPHAFVLSNDRFSEYPESPVVQQGRLIRREIVDGQMLVRELGIQVRFRETGGG